MKVSCIFQICVALLAILVLRGIAWGNDLMILNGSGPTTLMRFNGDTGAFVGKLATINSRAYSMTYGPDGNLYVGTASNISRYDGQTGAFLNVLVAGSANGLVPIPEDMTFGPDGNLYVAGNSTTAGKRGVVRYNGSTGQFIDLFAAPTDSFTQPGGLTFGPDGNLYVSNGFNVDRYNGTTGAFINHFTGPGGLERAGEVRFGPDGNIYVAGNSLLKFNGKTGTFMSDLFSITAENFAFGPDGNIYTAGFSIDRYTTSGSLRDHFILNGSGGLSSPGPIVFIPDPGTSAMAGIFASFALVRRTEHRRKSNCGRRRTAVR